MRSRRWIFVEKDDVNAVTETKIVKNVEKVDHKLSPINRSKFL